MSFHSASRDWGTFALRELTEEVCRPLASRLGAQAIRVEIDIPPSQMVTADRELIRRAVRNLLLNALDAMPEGGLLTATSAATEQMIELEIADTGASLTDEERQQAFELLPTVQRGGTGWGLAVVQRIAEVHGGGVTATNCPDGGVAFTLRIPHPAALEAAA
jgi:signal transduction histidine kinase